MNSKLWKELAVSEEEEELVRKIRESGYGRTLCDEKLNEFHVAKEWDMEIDTRVGKTLVHLYRPTEGFEKVPLFISMHGGGFVRGRRDQDIVFCRNISSRSGCMVMEVDYVSRTGHAVSWPGICVL